MSNILTKIERKKGLVYKVDKEGNVIEDKYNIFTDPYTLVTLAILILGGLYYMEMSRSATNATHFGEYCMKYSEMVSFWEMKNNATWDPTNSINTLVEFYNNNYNKVNSIPILSNYG